ncbi:FAD-dependent oxidoreductase [Arcobacter defluvii]|uniref:FAD-dependent oxidoreductase, possible FAD-dependent cmnm(5)s(2)U34 oxidoreductase n=1 Tax=Arcobacter defluvii TaxID=873191 RepID=A0AAE7BF38_9BACT|nr:FAD-dependent oxidoreductase [Arcobacter defluvii]QKF77403.1 FAD-dependent oxidoreductase, possible FAD-dependent cmnm(5)s(2)U34 oxidoreductase [Arcobacter defluvii]RXI32138.1 D-amino-acid oxidase [Arcobacter defluvii]
MKKYEYVVIGAGIAGCSLSHFLKKYSDSILLIDKNEDVASGASGAAGAFLSPLLGKPNKFKELITKALNFSMDYYKNNFNEELQNCGTCRIPRNQEDEEKFQSYIPYMDFEYEKYEDGYLFPIGSVIKPYEVCLKLSKDIEKLFNYEVSKIEKIDDYWLINDEIKAKKLFLSTGANISLIDEKYFDIRAVWGQKIDVLTSSQIDINYHKECSLSKSKKIDENRYLVSIGATHNRFDKDMKNSSYNLELANINKIEHNKETKEIIETDIRKLLKKANDIKQLNDIEVIDVKIGARASSIDYFPMVGKLIDSKKSFEKYPHIKNGTHIKNENLIMIDNLFVLNGVGGRGFVLSLYLANQLVQSALDDKKLDDEITNYRLFSRWAKKQKN